MSPSPTAADVNAFLPGAFPALAAAGVSCEHIGEDTATARWRYDPAALRPGNYISGATLFALADSALWFAVFAVVGLEDMAVTSEMSIRFLRPAMGGDVLAHADVRSASSRRIVGTIEVWVEGNRERLVAVAQGTYVRPQE